MRSPSSAPPPRRRVGSMARTATRSLSSWSSRSRRSSSSVSEDFPEPPVPVMPRTGTERRAAAARTCSASSGERPALQHRDRPGQGGGVAGEDRLDVGPGRREVDVAGADQLVDHAGQAEPLAVLGREDGDAPRPECGDLLRHDDAAPAAEHLHVPGTGLGQAVDEVAEVLDVPALVGREGHALHVLLEGRTDDGVDAAVVAEVHHLRALALQHPPHDVDRRVVPVEQAGRRHEPHRVDRHVQGRAAGLRGAGRHGAPALVPGSRRADDVGDRTVRPEVVGRPRTYGAPREPSAERRRPTRAAF